MGTLVLARKAGEKILIGNDIVITIVRISDGAVRVGVQAPPDVLVLRSELKKPLEGEREATDTH